MNYALIRSMMMREAIASCAIEGAVISDKRAEELVRHAAEGRYPCPYYEEIWCKRSMECPGPCELEEKLHEGDPAHRVL